MYVSKDYLLMKANLYNLNKKYKNTYHNLDNNLRELFQNSDFILGKYVEKLEKQISTYSNSRFVCSVANGTDALIFSLSYLKKVYPNKKKVITTPLSYLASTSSIFLSDLEPVFCDIDDSLNLDCEKLEKLIDKDTLAVLFVHYSGNPTNVERVKNICLQNNVELIEDCAQSFGSQVGDKYSGTFGFSGCVSLHPLKTLSCAGDGGFIMTQNQSFFEYLKLARNHGHINRDDVEFWSFNSRLDSLQAIVTLSQFDWFKKELEIRRKQYEIYKSSLEDYFFPRLEKGAQHSLNWSVLLLKNRAHIQEKLNAADIETKIHYPKLIYEMQPYKSQKFNLRNFENAERYSKQILSVPIGSHLSDDIILFICEQIKKNSD